MLKNEFSSLVRNKLLLLVVFAIILIPSIYAGLFLASMWDPYGELEYLPVAVVNLDKPVTYHDKQLKVGEELTDSLRDNDSMAFNIVDEDTAQNGLKNGTYYMVITIPEDFSENASSLMDDTPKKMILNYQTNPGKNYIAMKMSESAVKEIRRNITEEVTRTYAENVFDSLTEVGDGFDDAVDGTEEMLDGEEKLSSGNQKITKNLQKLADSTLTFKEGSETLTTGLETYTDGVAALDEGLNSLNGGVEQIADEAVNGAKEIAKGSKKLDKNLKKYTKGVATAAKGSKTLEGNNSALNQAISSVSTGVDELKGGSTQLLTGLTTMQTMLDTSLSEETVTQIKTAAESLPTLNQGIAQLNVALNGEDGSGSVDASALTGALTNVGGNIQTAGSDLTKAGSKVTEAVTILTTLVKTDHTLTASQKKAIMGAISALYSDSSEDNAAAMVQAAGKELTSAGATLTTLSGSDTVTLLGTLQSSVAKIAAASNQLLEPSATALTSLLGGMQSVQKALGQTQEKDGQTGLIEGMTTLDTGIATLKTGIGGENGLKSGLQSYTAGVSSLNAGMKQLKANNKKITDGTSALASGSNVLATGLDSGIGDLTAGVEKILKGSGKLVANNDKLLDGSEKLSKGAAKISNGSSKLADGSVELGDGLTELTDGTQELHDALNDGAVEIHENNATDATLDMFSAPVETEGEEITTVKNNGHAMAAYMLSVGLWVGCLAFCLMYPLASYQGEFEGGFKWWFSKAAVIYPLAIFMAFLVIGILHFTLGFTPESFARTLLVASVTSVTFMSIMYFFNILMGKVGSFVMLIFMVLQLAGSAGTYPVEISGSLVAAIHKWVPFTYTVDAFRSAISGGELVSHELMVLFCMGSVATLLTIFAFWYRGKRIMAGKPTIYEWIEEKGLA